MSIAITSTQNTMGVRKLSGYAIRPVWRGPAEPGPVYANHAVLGLQGLGTEPLPRNTLMRVPTQFLYHPSTPLPPVPSPSTSTPSQAPTGSVVSSYTDLNAAMAPNVANIVEPAPNPTAVATFAPASQPGYVVVSGGGGTTANVNPDYVGEILAWLESASLFETISPSLAIPNWIPALAVGAAFVMMMGPKHR